MYPDYITPNYVNGKYILPQLSSSDIEAVQKIYGQRYSYTNGDDNDGNTNGNDDDGESNNNEDDIYNGFLSSDYDPPPNECPGGRYYCPDDMACKNKDEDGRYQQCYKQWTNCRDGGWCPGVAQCFDSDNDGVTDKCTNVK
uniref:Uncharacterized protein n=1 Tax=Acrobeloides nanus TaxID=290746 RepID=A0A914EDJ6_9BILA